MDKTAQTEYPIQDLLARRWSPRAFANRSVETEKIGSLFEAARWAPSCYNAQPWRFIVATKDDPEQFEQLLSCLVEFNQSWARQAPVLVLTSARSSFELDNKPNAHAWHDVGLATQNLITQAQAFDLYTHAMAGFDSEKARKLFRIPAEYEPVTVLAIGYLGDALSLPEDLCKQEELPRERKPLTDLVFAGKWGKTSPLVSL